MSEFQDAFTGTIYRIGPGWLEAARETIAGQIRSRLKDDGKSAADAVASYWSETYYEQLFPLRFGLDTGDPGRYTWSEFFPVGGTLDLEELADKAKRERFLDGKRLPPLLPVTGEREMVTELLADRLLAQAALANVLFRQEGIPSLHLHAIRLAFLTYPLLDYLDEALAPWREARAVARFLAKQAAELPDGLDPVLIKGVRDGVDLSDREAWLVQVAVKRVKRYVFETPGLNEIRGASTLLDDLTEAAKKAVSMELGSEVLLRAVGSTLLFLAPTETEAADWAERIRRAFYQATGTAFTAAGRVKVSVEALLRDYQGVSQEANAVLEADRARGELVTYETLPFETRCQLCRLRPAEGWDRLPGEERPVPLCRVCKTKREAGHPQRAEKAKHMLEKWLELPNPSVLGVEGRLPKEYVAQSLGRADPTEEGFIPPDARRPLIATIYGDGNNFGAVGQKLTSMAQGRQWTQRVEKTTRAAVAVALARATQEVAQDRGWDAHNPKRLPLPKLPFQVLALGGDDLSLFAWAPIGVRFASHFLHMMGLEFQASEEQQDVDQVIAFSLGALMADHKAAVRRTVTFAEDELLAWAKQAFRDSRLQQGNVAMLLANNQEQIPDDLKRYRAQMYRRGGKDQELTLYLTLRPLSGEELAWLLKKAQSLQEHSGRLNRLVSVFAQSPPLVAMLHYIYQRGRFDASKDHWLKKLEEIDASAPKSMEDLHYPAGSRSMLGQRKPFGLDHDLDDQAIWFTPLWDLLELVKVLE